MRTANWSLRGGLAGHRRWWPAMRRMLEGKTAMTTDRTDDKAGQAVEWLPLADAPMYVYGRDALIGEYVAGYGWKKVAIWEPTWTRDDIISRGGTHWWPHMRDLPEPEQQEGVWTLTAPDGRAWQAGSPQKAGSLEIQKRITRDTARSED